jgi:hypothetical protein
MAAAIDVLPTPPLPVTNRSLRSRRGGSGAVSSAPEADAAIAVGRADFDVRDLLRRNSHPAAALVDQPEHLGSAAEGGFDPGVDLFTLLVGELDAELARGMGHADSYVHGPDGSRVHGPIRRARSDHDWLVRWRVVQN